MKVDVRGINLSCYFSNLSYLISNHGTQFQAKALEISYNELRRRKEIEEVLANEKQEFQNMKKQWNEERLTAVDQRVSLENQVATFNYMIKKLEEEKLSAVEMSQVYKREQDELLVERNDALKVAEELLGQQAEPFSVFSLAEIHEASCNFDPSLKIGEQGYWNIYKGLLHSTTVAIKVLNTDSSQAHSEFQQEVEVMSKIRHPNLITLIGACPEACALIYEYLPNGSLQDRLSCKENSPPLSWQTRIRIATDICSVLIFLHSTKPRSLVYGDLKAENILLDDNLVCKLSDFRIPHRPRVLEMEEVSPKSDIYLFGVILLQLLTGKSPLNIANEVQDVVVEGNLVAFLDFSAGDWPFVQATQLAHLALRCCDIDPNKRPDLAAEVWMALLPIRASCGVSSSSWLGSQGHSQPPSYFICPILQEVMQDPHVAADGFTYEKEALMGWLQSGHDTSPMTNLRLANLNLVPNHALRSVIREWLQHR
ncbi:U-box domain-containing protein 33-like [Pistacia vera]|uniref:U-box domain-containing protein 33-like n=1 Tax=Pistacia vera TaxID=55513 RepID=UPI001262DBEF|nr:U-box domain-containing protein 33-like [Pistacia vera]